MKKIAFILGIVVAQVGLMAQDRGDTAYTSTKTLVAPKNKYDFGKIGFKANKISNVQKSFELQSSTSLSTGLVYNLNLEAHEYINRFKVKNESELRRMKTWGAHYLSTMENILMSKGIPKQLVYLSVIETHLNPRLVSWAGAAGMWQFMPETGRMYGLHNYGGVDERFDWYKSTYAAADYLRYLYNQFHDWLLVVAAYNGGPGRVSGAIRRSGSKDFWSLQGYLPYESSNHVKKFIATQYIMEGSTAIAVMKDPSKGVPVKKSFFNPLEKGAVALDTTKGLQTEQMSGRYNSLIICKYIMLDIQSFNILNPNFDAELAKEESNYSMRLPESKMMLFKQNKLQIMNESLYLYLTLNGGLPSSDLPSPKTTPKKANKKVKK